MSGAVTPLATVVLADDLPEIRLMIRKLLEIDGRFEVVGEASNGSEVLEALEKHKPDAVILDVAMPGMDGLDALPAIVERAPETKVLVLSGFDAERMAPMARQRGAHGYVEKGTDLRELIDHLAGLIEGLPEAPLGELPAGTLGPAQPESETKAIDDILSVLIHELQAPLAVIEGFGLALTTAVERDDQKAILESTEAIKRSSRSLRSLIRSFSDARALESGRFTLQKRATEIDKLVRQTMDDLAMVNHTHPVTIHAPGEVPVVYLDSIRIRQVITNLISNAAKFSARGSPIDINVMPHEDAIAIAVRDRGSGIPRERLDELFKKFSRLGARGAGTGLGLYISRGIARAHGGDVTLQTQEAVGSTFTLTLPVPGEPSPED